MTNRYKAHNLHPDPHCYRQRATWMGLPATQGEEADHE